MMKKKLNKGFTLIELLVVIAIIAILAVVVILTLNPAQLLAQARDSNRTSDMATLKSAVALYLADVSSTNLGVSATCYVSQGATTTLVVPNAVTSTTSGTNSTTTCASWMSTASGVATTSASRAISGTGWIPINFNAISAGSPFGQEPVDPLVTNNRYFYSYIATSTSNNFKVASKMESVKYSSGGGGDVETNDGGNNVNFFEQGTLPTL